MTDDQTTTPTTTTTNQSNSCEVEIQFPLALQAEQTMRVLQVDNEPTTRVTKSFRISESDPTIMIATFQSKELKMLRVALSSFSDYATVVLRTMNEFGSEETWSQQSQVQS